MRNSFRRGIALSEILALAHMWNIRSLVHAVVTVLSEQGEEYDRELIKTMPSNYLPYFARNDRNNGYALHLLSLMKQQNLPIDQSDINECFQTSSKKLFRLMGARFKKKGAQYLAPELQEQLKQILIKDHMIPNFSQLWNLSNGDDKKFHALSAWRDVDNGWSDQKVYFFQDDGRVSSFDEDREKVSRSFLSNACYTCAVYYRNHEKFLAGNKEGVVTVNTEYDGDDAIERTIITGSQWGAVIALACHLDTIAATYQNGVVALYVPNNECIQLNASARVENEEQKAKRAKLSDSSFYYKIAINSDYVCASCTSGVVKIWDAQKHDLLLTIPLPLKDNQVSALHLKGSVLYMGSMKGTFFVVDLKKALEKNAQQVNYCKTLVCDLNERFYKTVCCIAPLSERYIAVAYSEGRIRVWDLETKTVFKSIDHDNSNDDVLMEDIHRIAGLEVIKGILEVIYYDGLIHRYFIPECAKLEDVLRVIKTKNLGW